MHALKPGMYVAALDRPWLETPFNIQGFYVRERNDIDRIGKHCVSVWVDPRKPKLDSGLTSRAKSTLLKPIVENSVTFSDELPEARKALANSSEVLAKAFEKLKSKGLVDVPAVQSAIDPLIESVLRNDEVVAALIRMRRKGEYLFNHSLAVSVWAALLGRHLGFEKKRLAYLAKGAALLDVGMVTLPSQITASSAALDEESRLTVQTHVMAGVHLLEKQASVVSPLVLEMIASHHERFDGSGYPGGIANTAIPLFGRIAGLVDTYDAMITPRPYAVCRTSFQAMQELSDMKDELFQGSLVEQFMQAIGVFPTGSLVKLNTGEIGVVVQQNSARRLRPKIVVILDPKGDKLDKLVAVDLSKYSSDHSKTDLWITQELEPGAFGIQADEYFL